MISALVKVGKVMGYFLCYLLGKCFDVCWIIFLVLENMKHQVTKSTLFHPKSSNSHRNHMWFRPNTNRDHLDFSPSENENTKFFSLDRFRSSRFSVKG